MPNHRGGIAAIGGFLFQVMVAAGLRTATEIFETAGDGTELQALIKLAGQTDIFTEAFDQDIALKECAERLRAGLTLVQVKYSENQSSIGPAEMQNDIYPAFVRAYEAARDEGEECTSLCLITNRPVSANLQGNLAAENKNFLTRLHFKTYAEYGFDVWRGYLDTFCRQYGWSPDEINTRVDALLGHILHRTQQSGGGYKLEKDGFLVSLAGSRSARPLSRKNAIEMGLSELGQFGDRARGEAVRREILNKAEEGTENRALIVFEGQGGVGKTASLLKWVSSIAELDDPGAPMISVQGAEGARNPWLPEFVTRLNPALDVRTDADSIRRFETANPANHGVLFHLSLDGIDDRYPTDGARASVVSLLRHYLQADEQTRAGGTIPQSRLVVTCRCFETVCKDLLRLPRTALNGDDYRDRALCLPFEFFSENELRDLINLNCRTLLPYVFPFSVVFGEAAVYGSFAYTGENVRNRAEQEAETDLKAIDAASAISSPKKNYANILSDPVMWASFMELDDDQREAWLKGDDSFETRMAELYVNRFILKAHHRLGPAESILGLSLREIAHANSDDTTFRTRTEWITWATSTGLLDKIAAGQLFEEAMSGGLVTWNAQLRWQWRSPLIAAFLRLEVES